MFPLNYKFSQLLYFEKIGSTGQTDERTDGVQRLIQPPMEGRVLTDWLSELRQSRLDSIGAYSVPSQHFTSDDKSISVRRRRRMVWRKCRDVILLMSRVVSSRDVWRHTRRRRQNSRRRL